MIDGLQARRARRAGPATRRIRSGCATCRPRRRRERAGDRRRGGARCSTCTTRSPTSRSPRACTRRCWATTTASPRRSTPTRRAGFPPEPAVVAHAAQRHRPDAPRRAAPRRRASTRRLAGGRRADDAAGRGRAGGQRWLAERPAGARPTSAAASTGSIRRGHAARAGGHPGRAGAAADRPAVRAARRGEQAMGELDDRIVRHVVDARFAAARHAALAIRLHRRAAGAGDAVFELAPLRAPRCARCCGGRGRCAPTDLALRARRRRAQDEPVADRRERPPAMDARAHDLDALPPTLDACSATPTAPRRRRRRRLADALATLLERAARFGVPQAGWGFAYDLRSAASSPRCSRACGRSSSAGTRGSALRRAARRLHAAAAPRPPTRRGSPRCRQPSCTHDRADHPAAGDARGAIAPPLAAAPAPRSRPSATALRRCATHDAPDCAELLADVRRCCRSPPSTRPRAVHRRRRGRRDGRLRTELAGGVTRVERRARAPPRRGRRAPGRARRRRRSPARRVDALSGGGQALLGEDFVVVPEFALPAAAADELATRDGRVDARATSFDGARGPRLPGRRLAARRRAGARKLRAWEQVDDARRRARPPASPSSRRSSCRYRAGDRWLGLRATTPATDARRRPAAVHRAPRRPVRPAGAAVRPAPRRVDRGRSRRRGRHRHRRSTTTGPNTEPPQAMLLVDAGRAPRRLALGRPGRRAATRRSTWPSCARSSPAHLDATAVRAVPAGHACWRSRCAGITIAADLALNNRVCRYSWSGLMRCTVDHRHPRRALRRAPASRRSRCGTGWRAGPRTERLRPRAARRGPRRAVDADPPVADRRVPRRRRRARRSSRERHVATTRLTRYRPRRRTASRSTTAMPLEAQVERAAARVHWRGGTARARPAAAWAASWLKLLAGVGDYRRPSSSRATRSPRPIPTTAADAPARAHPEAWQPRGRRRAARWTARSCYEHLPATRPPRLGRHRGRSTRQAALDDARQRGSSRGSSA